LWRRRGPARPRCTTPKTGNETPLAAVRTSRLRPGQLRGPLLLSLAQRNLALRRVDPLTGARQQGDQNDRGKTEALPCAPWSSRELPNAMRGILGGGHPAGAPDAALVRQNLIKTRGHAGTNACLGGSRRRPESRSGRDRGYRHGKRRAVCSDADQDQEPAHNPVATKDVVSVQSRQRDIVGHRSTVLDAGGGVDGAARVMQC